MENHFQILLSNSICAATPRVTTCSTRATWPRSSRAPCRQGLTLAHFRAQLEDLREHIAHVRTQLEHLRATSTGKFGVHVGQSELKLSGKGQSKLKLIGNGNECKPLHAGHAPVLRQQGRAVQIHPIKPTLKVPGTKRLELKHSKLLSSFAFNFNPKPQTLNPKP